MLVAITRERRCVAYYTCDNDGFRPNRGANQQYRWLAPTTPLGLLYQPAATDWKSFATLSQLRAATGQESHGMEVDFDIFVDLKPPDASKRYAIYHAAELNFSLKPAAKAVDAGVPLPNINDDFAGGAPDLGAEAIVGPRTRWWRSPVGLC